MCFVYKPNTRTHILLKENQVHLKKKLISNFIIYFHNDPLSMKGSKSPRERIDLLNKVEKIIFVSEWVQKRFFIDLDQRLLNKTEVVYPSIHKQNKLLNPF